MNQLKTDINGKFPFYLNDIRFLDDAYRMAFEALAKAVSFNENVILWGLDVTDNGSNNYTFSEGAVVISGEMLKVEEGTFDVTSGQTAIVIKDNSWDAAGLKLFGDGNQNDTYKVVKGIIEITSGSVVSGYVDILNARRISELQDFDGLIYKGKLTSSDDLNYLTKPGLYTIVGNSTPAHFPEESILALEDETIGQSSNFWLKVIYLGDNRIYQELGFKNGIIARRSKSEFGWNSWQNFWAKPEEVLEGVKKCCVVSPYTLQAIVSVLSDELANHAALTDGAHEIPAQIQSHESWITPTYLGNFASGAGLIQEIYYRKLADGRIEIRGEAKCELHHTDTDVIQLPTDYRPNVALKYAITPGTVSGTTDTITIGTDGKLIFTNAHYRAFINLVFSIN